MSPTAAARALCPGLLVARACRLAVALALVLAVAPARADSRPLALRFDPEVPTWHQTVNLLVDGVGCGPSLSVPQLDMTTRTLDVDLYDICGVVSLPPPARAFHLVAELPLLRAGTFTVRVHDVENGGAPTVASLIVYEVSDVLLDEEGPTTDAAPPKIHFTAIFSCATGGFSIHGHVIEVHYQAQCPFEPPPPHIQEVTVPITTPLTAGDYEVRLFDDNAFGAQPPGLVTLPLRVWKATGCVPAASRLCLRDGRFAVEGTWHDFAGHQGAAQASPLPGNDGSGLLWFFAPDSLELTVKLLDACALNGHWWTFLASSSTVAYEITITDTLTHAQRHYSNASGAIPSLIADVEALPCP